MERRRLRLIVDENVPSSVAHFLRERGHEVSLVLDLFPAGTADPVIARMASELRATVVTHNCRHFKGLAARITKKGAPSYPGMSLFGLTCKEEFSLGRIQEHIHLIESEAARLQVLPDSRLIIEIGNGYLRIER